MHSRYISTWERVLIVPICQGMNTAQVGTAGTLILSNIVVAKSSLVTTGLDTARTHELERPASLPPLQWLRTTGNGPAREPWHKERGRGIWSTVRSPVGEAMAQETDFGTVCAALRAYAQAAGRPAGSERCGCFSRSARSSPPQASGPRGGSSSPMCATSRPLRPAGTCRTRCATAWTRSWCARRRGPSSHHQSLPENR